MMFNSVLNNKYNISIEYLIRFFSEVFSKSFNFLIIPIITYNLSVIEYGFYVQIICIISGLIPLTTLGLNFTIIKNLAGDKSIKSNSQNFFSTIIFISISSLFLLIFSFLFFHFINISYLKEIVFLIFFLILTTSLELITLEMLRAKTQSNFFCLLQVLSPLLILILLFTMSNLNSLSINNILISFSCIKFLTTILGIYILIKKKFVAYNSFIAPSKILKIYIYPGITFMLIGFSEWIINYSDKLIIGYYLDNKIVSIYYTIGLLSSIILSIGSVFWWKLYPTVSKLKSRNQKTKMFKLIHDLNNIFIELVIPTILIITLIGPSLINILLNIDEFNSNLLIFYFASCVLIHQVSTGWEFYCYIEDKGKFILKNTLLWGLISLILNFILIPRFSIYGAVTALFITKIGFSISLLLYVKNRGYLYDILNYSNVIKLMISFLVAIFAFLIFRNINFSLDNFFLKDFILAASALSVYFFFRYLFFFYLKNKHKLFS